ncbi:MAG: radical SAM protein [Lachnospiraceae bacterium]|nr:radical SAM protein [Lachnospiraceae bacterium]MDY2956032.1 radical SAM protein [Lachnospiraceae bacterium]
MSKIDFAHKAQRKMFEAVLDSVIRHSHSDRNKAIKQLVDLVKKTMYDIWGPATYEMFGFSSSPDSKWMKYIDNLLNDVHPNIIKGKALNTAYEAGYRGFRIAQDLKKKHDVSIPWIILIDPTSACNLKCTGCWSAEYGNLIQLSYEDLDRVITEGEELGIYAWLMTGGEPLIRKADILKLAEKHPYSSFHIFTNGTLIDDAFCEEVVRLGNIAPSISLEGFEEVNDLRRGKGVFQKVMHAMDIMRKHKLLFGTSICYTSSNYKTVTSDEFLDMIISKGVKYTWYFHYMPVGNDASTDLLLSPEQREYMYNRVREIRGGKGGKPIIAVDFQNDGEYVSGCVAGGKYYCHINPNGDVEPCVFIHYSSANIHDMSLLDCLKQPLFKAYKDNQPFNPNHLKPCPMLENPEKLVQMVHETGAKSTDLQSPEPVEHLCGKCENYAADWEATADRLWNAGHHVKK